MGHNGDGQPTGNRNVLDSIMPQFFRTYTLSHIDANLRPWSRLPGNSTRETPIARTTTKPERAK
eukprot:8021706-Pyramimonas_sp.AAC.1